MSAKNVTVFAAGVLLVGSMFATTSALAREEMIVTARKTQESLMELPISVSAVTAESIEQANLASINDLATITPGLQFNSAFGRQADRPVIRGQSAIATGTELAGIFVDGIWISESIQSLDFDSVERVEIIKGPQSAVFGRRTFSGAINYVTKGPSEDLYFGVKTQLGSNSLAELSGTVSDTVGIFGYRVNARTSTYDGDFNNSLTTGINPSPDVSGQEQSSVNGAFVLTPRDTTTVTLNLMYSTDDDDLYAIALQPSTENNCTFGTRPYYCGTLQTNTPVRLGGLMQPGMYGIERDRFRSSVKIDQELGALDLSALVAYNKMDIQSGQDQSFNGNQTAFSFTTFGQVPGNEWHTVDDDDYEDLTAELWLRGSHLDDALTWSAGLYYFDEDVDGIGSNGDGSISNTSKDKVRNTAIMGGVSYTIADAVNLNLELRYAEDEIEASEVRGATTTFNKDTFESLTHRFTASWYATDTTMAYFNWSTGVLPGSFNSDPRLPARLVSVDEQTLDQFEFGVKSDITETVRAIAAVYFLDWDDQVRSQFYDGSPEGPAGSISPPIGYDANEGNTETKGVELALEWQALDSLLLAGGISYNDSEVKNFISADATDVAITGDGNVSGAQLPLSPKWDANVNATHTAEFGRDFMLTSRLDVSYQDERYIRLVNLADTGDATIVDLTIALEKDAWRVALWGKNIFDEDSVVSGLRYIENDSFFLAGRAFAVTPRVGREFGLTASYKFGDF